MMRVRNGMAMLDGKVSNKIGRHGIESERLNQKEIGKYTKRS